MDSLFDGILLDILTLVNSKTLLKLLTASECLNMMATDRVLWRIYFKDVCVTARNRRDYDEVARLCTIGELGHLIKIDFSGINSITEITPFGTVIKEVHELDLSGTSVADISTLATLKMDTLFLTDCRFIDDVSVLKHVRLIDLGGCTGVADISGLGDSDTLRTLSLWGCTKIEDVTALGGIKSLHRLYLNKCVNVENVSMLGRLHTLSLVDCIGVTDVSDLGSLYELDLTGCINVTDVKNLNGVHTLNLTRCTNVVKSVVNLTLPK